MARWTMVIDLRKCIGCGTCKTACSHLNKVPINAPWRRLIEGKADGGTGRRLFMTMGCMHCGKAPCLEACPSNATHRRADGIIEIDYERCLGCGACIVACPYRSRSIVFEDWLPYEGETDPEGADGPHPDRIGVCTKCNFCRPRVDEALEQGLRPGVDRDATPVCVSHCIAGALHFGDLDDPESEVSKMLRDNAVTRLKEELGTEPSVYYIVE